MKKSENNWFGLAVVLAAVTLLVLWMISVTNQVDGDETIDAVDTTPLVPGTNEAFAGLSKEIKADEFERINTSLDAAPIKDSLRMKAVDFLGQPFGREISVLRLPEADWNGDLRSYSEIQRIGVAVGVIPVGGELLTQLGARASYYVGVDSSGCFVQGVEEAGMTVFKYPPEGEIQVSIIAIDNNKSFRVKLIAPGRYFEKTEDGLSFVFKNIPFGTYQVWVEGFGSIGTTWVEHSGAITKVELQVFASVNLLVSVKDSETGNLIPNASLLTHPLSGYPSPRLQPDGRLLVEGLNPEDKTARFRVTAPGYADRFFLYKFPTFGELWEADIPLEHGRRLDFTCSLDGKLQSGVNAFVYYRNKNWGYESGLQHYGQAEGRSNREGEVSVLIPDGAILEAALFVSNGEAATWHLLAEEIDAEITNNVSLARCKPIAIKFLGVTAADRRKITATCHLKLGRWSRRADVPTVRSLVTDQPVILLYPQPGFLLRIRENLSGAMVHEEYVLNSHQRLIEVTLPTEGSITMHLFDMEGQPLKGTVDFRDYETQAFLGSSPITSEGLVSIEDLPSVKCRVEVLISGDSSPLFVDNVSPSGLLPDYQLSPNGVSFMTKQK